MSTEFDFGSGYARILGHDCTIMSNCRIAYHDQMQRRSPIELEGRTSLLDYAMRLTPSPEPPTREFGPIWQYWHSGKAISMPAASKGWANYHRDSAADRRDRSRMRKARAVKPGLLL